VGVAAGAQAEIMSDNNTMSGQHFLSRNISASLFGLKVTANSQRGTKYDHHLPESIPTFCRSANEYNQADGRLALSPSVHSINIR
jgi:hypothetical protein